ncbi:MAG: hypothetical protein O3A92_05025 [Verrucomicrobia bacterium]|nr:hypothetical protein [Verrucomicrobiota bacterium]
MKPLILVLALASCATISRGEELRMAVCCIDYAVRNHPDFEALKRLATESPSNATDLLLQRKQTQLRAKVRVIVKNFALERNYQWVFEV